VWCRASAVTLLRAQIAIGGELNKDADREISEILNDIRHYLPSQGPIKYFIHHNTLHMFQEHGLSFHEASRQASRLYGAKEYLPIAEYRQAFHDGKISDAALDWVIANERGDGRALREAMLNGSVPELARRESFRRRGYLAAIVQQSGIVLEEQVHPIVFRVVANFLDQGIAAISLAANNSNDDFWQALRRQLRVVRPYGIVPEVAELISVLEPEAAARQCLDRILPAHAGREVFLLEVLMAARGWSGLIGQVEERPQYLNYPRKITLLQYVALYLLVLTQQLEGTRYGKEQLPQQNENLLFFTEHCPAESDAERIFRLWHEALEFSFYFETLTAIQVNAPRRRRRSSAAGNAQFQAIFCIDDRECSVRRYLEEFSDSCETFGTPGFFGIDAVYQGPFDAISIKQCPVPVTPRHRIRGVSQAKRRLAVSRMELNFWHRYANKLWLGWIISLVFGLVSLVRLVLSIHRPSKSFATASSFAAREDLADLHYERLEGAPPVDGFFDGYTVKEMAERVARVLRQIGLTHDFAPLVALVGHGSTSTNNPYFAAYDCGACSGRPGLVNARAFALMANRADVRLLLKKNGISVPETTRFIGAIHDTARDELLLLDEDALGAEHAALLLSFRELFTKALAQNAHERARRFAIVDFPQTVQAAMREARLRTEMLFEPRPEYNHATNALAIVGRRSLTENLFLDRRAFFNSYEPDADKDGTLLGGILTPLVPVCGGINLEYLFSRVDNTVYGAGSKLPHNVLSLIGVGNGSEGDLRTGLPEQMIEIHDPVRLMILVEQRLSVVKRTLEGNAPVREWIEKDWVKFCVYDHRAAKFYWWLKGKFVPLNLSGQRPPVYENSLAAYRHQRENLKPAVLHGGNRQRAATDGVDARAVLHGGNRQRAATDGVIARAVIQGGNKA